MQNRRVRSLGLCMTLLSALLVGCSSTPPTKAESVPTATKTTFATQLPRGLRNHNPGNIRKTESMWIGEVPCADPQFKCFESDRYGIRAMWIVVNTYWRDYSIRTVEGIIHRWAPPSENPTNEFTRFVRERVQSRTKGWTVDPVGRTYILDRDSVYPALISAMIYFENGSNPFSLSEIQEAKP